MLIYLMLSMPVVLLYREEAENTTELETDSVSGSSTGGQVGLNVQGTRISRSILTLADASTRRPVLPYSQFQV
jgi:hypothetical protein